jgi:hypothetical protein
MNGELAMNDLGSGFATVMSTRITLLCALKGRFLVIYWGGGRDGALDPCSTRTFLKYLLALANNHSHQVCHAPDHRFYGGLLGKF